MAKKKRKVSKKKILIFIIIVVVIAAIIFTIIKLTTKNEKVQVIKSVDNIKEYGYTLDDNETKYYKNVFQQLKDCLNKKEVDEETYARLVTKLFVSDLYNLDNKVTKNDVGGVQFVYKDFQNDFRNIAKTTMYRSVKSNLYEDRDQELPIVTSVIPGEFENKAFTYGENTDDKAYYIPFEIEYKSDLGYQKTGSIVLIHNDKKLELVKLTEE